MWILSRKVCNSETEVHFHLSATVFLCVDVGIFFSSYLIVSSNKMLAGSAGNLCSKYFQMAAGTQTSTLNREVQIFH